MKNVALGKSDDPGNAECKSPMPYDSVKPDLCHAMASANIPKRKLESEEFKQFIEKYTGHAVPHESTTTKK